MHRRSFLKFLLSTPLAAVVDYEKLLWVPGEKTIFIPEVQPVSMYKVIYEWSEMMIANPRACYRISDISSEELKYTEMSRDEAIAVGLIRPHEIESLDKFMIQNA